MTATFCQEAGEPVSPPRARWCIFRAQTHPLYPPVGHGAQVRRAFCVMGFGGKNSIHAGARRSSSSFLPTVRFGRTGSPPRFRPCAEPPFPNHGRASADRRACTEPRIFCLAAGAFKWRRQCSGSISGSRYAIAHGTAKSSVFFWVQSALVSGMRVRVCRFRERRKSREAKIEGRAIDLKKEACLLRKITQ